MTRSTPGRRTRSGDLGVAGSYSAWPLRLQEGVTLSEAIGVLTHPWNGVRLHEQFAGRRIDQDFSHFPDHSPVWKGKYHRHRPAQAGRRPAGPAAPRTCELTSILTK